MSDEVDTKKDQVPSWRLKEWFPKLNNETHDQLKQYFTELLKFNKAINLISPKTMQQADAFHFADSVLACNIVRENISKNSPLYDFGSGNGFPGMVYAILYPDQGVFLVDSDERKCEFLRHVIATLKLKNVSVQNINIEKLESNSVRQAICRGFAPLPKALLMLRKIIQKGGAIFHLKSEEWAIEISQIPIQLCSIWQPMLVSEYVLPAGDVKMYVVKTDKIE